MWPANVSTVVTKVRPFLLLALGANRWKNAGGTANEQPHRWCLASSLEASRRRFLPRVCVSPSLPSYSSSRPPLSPLPPPPPPPSPPPCPSPPPLRQHFRDPARPKSRDAPARSARHVTRQTFLLAGSAPG